MYTNNQVMLCSVSCWIQLSLWSKVVPFWVHLGKLLSSSCAVLNSGSGLA